MPEATLTVWTSPESCEIWLSPITNIKRAWEIVKSGKMHGKIQAWTSLDMPYLVAPAPFGHYLSDIGLTRMGMSRPNYCLPALLNGVFDKI